MTAAGATAAPVRSPLDAMRGFRLRPAEGWLTVIGAMAMVATFGWSLIDANWTGTTSGDANFLPWVGMIGLAFGIVGAKIGWGRWRTHVVGAVFAGIFLPLVVGGIVLGPGTGWDLHALAARMAASLRVAQAVWSDLVIQNRPFTTQIAHYYLIFGGLVWGAGLLTGFSIFGHHRPLDAIVVVGLATIVNMALTTNDQLYMMIVFSAGALLVLVRTHVFDEEGVWARRRIGDPSSIGSLYLTGGGLFVAGAIIAASVLTFTASSAPLQGLWTDLPHSLQGLQDLLQKIAPPGGNVHGIGDVGFGTDVSTIGLWAPSDATAFRAQIVSGQDLTWKWRAGTYAIYTNYGWKQGDTRDEPTAARGVLLANDQAGDAPTTDNTRQVTYRITPDAFRDATILGPNQLYSVDRPTTAQVIGPGYFATVTTDQSGTYNATAKVRVPLDVPGGLTEERLRLAGTDYPADLMAEYGPASLPDGAMGPKATELLNTIKAQVKAPSYADPSNPYDLARTMETYLRDAKNFTYNTDVRSLRNQYCSNISSVECFATIKQGYCEYYASTMAVLLRASGVPARIAYGFLPSKADASGEQVVAAKQAHWWVEVWFPGVGWFEFDPTGGGVGKPTELPAGSIPVATPKVSKAPSTIGPVPSFGGPTQQSNGGQTGTGIGPFIAIAVILVVGFAALAVAALRRAPRRPMAPDMAWGSLSRLATRFGLGPKPSQTVYEYAGVLGDTVPGARLELTTIARAKVEVAYGRQDLGPDRLKRIAEAYQRLRLALLGVVVRRFFQRPRRRSR